MYEVTIDSERCRKDGLCAMICPDNVIRQDERTTVPTISDDHMEHCIACGQCVAICPQGAIRHSQFSSTAIRPNLSPMPTEGPRLCESRKA